MQVNSINGIKIYIPMCFQDIYELCQLLHKVTKCVIIDCSSVRILPSHFISLAINKNNFIALIGVSQSAKNIFKSIGVENDVKVYDTISAALYYFDSGI